MKKRLIKKIKKNRICPKCKIGTRTNKYSKMEDSDKDSKYYEAGFGYVEYHIHCKKCGFPLVEMSYSAPYSIWDMSNFIWEF